MLILFPDDHHVTECRNITWQQATITPSEPLLKPDYHWEGNRTHLYGSIIRHEEGASRAAPHRKPYEMYYQCGNALRVGYAVSDDGWHWEKPMINRADFSASVHQVVQANDQVEASDVPELGEGQVMTNLAAGYHMPSVIFEAQAEHPYKMFAFGEAGFRVLYSLNGRQFTEYPDNPAIAEMHYKNETTGKTWVSDVSPCFRDRDGYTAMVKTYHVDAQGRTRRCIGRSISEDFCHWSEVETVWIPGPEEDEIARRRGYEWADFYGLCPFFWGNGYLGFLWLFEIEKELPRGTNLGKMEAFLAYSPDGKQWRRLSDQPLVPWDLNYGEDGGMITTPSAPVFEADAIKIYYSDSNFEHGFAEKDFTKPVASPVWVTRCCELSKERLVGAAAEQGEMHLAFAPIRSRRLRLNLSAGEGQIELELLSGKDVVHCERVAEIDSTDWVIDLPEGVYDGLRVRLNHAVLYALEL